MNKLHSNLNSIFSLVTNSLIDTASVPVIKIVCYNKYKVNIETWLNENKRKVFQRNSSKSKWGWVTIILKDWYYF